MKIIYSVNRNFVKVTTVLFVFVMQFSVVSAQAVNPGPCNPAGGTICNPIPNIKSIPDFIKTVLEGMLKIGIPIIALAIIYCGFLFVAARGNSEKITKAKDALLYTLIGSAILLGSWAIAKLISETVLAL